MDRNSAERLVKATLTQPFDEARFRHLAINLLEGLDEDKAFHWVAGNYIRDAFKDHVKKYRRLGTYTDPQGRKVELLVVHLKNPWALERSRSTQRNFVAEYLKQRGEKDAALIAYHVDEPTDWRFSFVRMEYREEITPDGRVKVKEEFTPSRRYSFLVGASEPSHTAQQQLVPLLEEVERPTLDQIEQAFGVERVTKAFYTDYRVLFEKVRDALSAIAERDGRVRDEFSAKTIDPSNFAKKLLGQLVFLYFLQKKGWLGVGRDAQGNIRSWGEGPKDFLRRLHQKDYVEYANFFDDVLEPLFYEALATERADDFYSRFRCRIPFLNGGLFEPLNGYNWREVDIRLPNELIQEILDIFDRYNFTVREDDPLDREVAVDPEMLGKVFENLLPENLRKGKGSYYTPRNVVHFMCQESLIHYLDGAVNRGETPLVSECEQPRLVDAGEPEQMKLQGEGRSVRVPRADLEEFIRRSEFSQEMDAATASGTKSHKFRIPASVRAEAETLDAALGSISVCDPAVGSGAFLVGMMHEIVKARLILKDHFTSASGRTPYELKRHAIHNALYGVDIDAGAVDIAKLRLWLSLVVDEDEYASIHPLPNLDYKLMQGNSLFEDFHGISLALGEAADEGTLLRKDQGLVERIGKLHRTQGAYFDATHHSDKKQLRDAVENAVLDVFTYAIEQKNKGYYEDLGHMLERGKKAHLRGSPDISDVEIKNLKVKYGFDPDALETELRDMTHGNRLRDFFPWRLYFADVFQEKGGFDVVISNPPYVRADAGETMLRLRERIRGTGQYRTLSGKWDIYVPFVEKGVKLLRYRGNAHFITSDALCHAVYAKKLTDSLVKEETVLRIDLAPRLRFFDAAVHNVIFQIRREANPQNAPARVVHEGSFEAERILPTSLQREADGSIFHEAWSFHGVVPDVPNSLPLQDLCYVSVGAVCNAHEKKARGAFVLADLLSEAKDEKHARTFVEGKDIDRWLVRSHKYIEWGTRRSPSLLRRPTFEALYTPVPKLLLVKVSGQDCRAAIDYAQHFCNEGVFVCVPWHMLRGVRNRSIRKAAAYRSEEAEANRRSRDVLEELSKQVHIEYLLGVLNSSVAHYYLRVNRRSNVQLYPEDWKSLPIVIPDQRTQDRIVGIVRSILETVRRGGNPEKAERLLDKAIAALYPPMPKCGGNTAWSTASGVPEVQDETD